MDKFGNLGCPGIRSIRSSAWCGSKRHPCRPAVIWLRSFQKSCFASKRLASLRMWRPAITKFRVGVIYTVMASRPLEAMISAGFRPEAEAGRFPSSSPRGRRTSEEACTRGLHARGRRRTRCNGPDCRGGHTCGVGHAARKSLADRVLPTRVRWRNKLIRLDAETPSGPTSACRQ